MTTLVTIGYGDRYPSCVDEMAMVIIIMVCCIAMFGYTMGTVSSELKNLEDSEKSKTNMDKFLLLDFWIDKLEQKKAISNDIKQKIYNHFSYYWMADRLVGMQKKYWTCSSADDMIVIDDPFLSKLDYRLMDKLMIYMFDDIFYHFKWFFTPYQFDDCEFKYHICFHFQPRKYDPGQDIITKGENQYELILATDGIINMGPVINGNQIQILSFNKTVLGDYEIFTKNKSYSTFRAFDVVQAIAIPQKPLLEILNLDRYQDYYKSLKSKIVLRHSEIKKQINQFAESYESRNVYTDSFVQPGQVLETQENEDACIQLNGKLKKEIQLVEIQEESILSTSHQVFQTVFRQQYLKIKKKQTKEKLMVNIITEMKRIFKDLNP